MKLKSFDQIYNDWRIFIIPYGLKLELEIDSSFSHTKSECVYNVFIRFQNSKDSFDLIFTAEERVYDQCIESLESRGSNAEQLVHVINLDIQVVIFEQYCSSAYCY